MDRRIGWAAERGRTVCAAAAGALLLSFACPFGEAAARTNPAPCPASEARAAPAGPLEAQFLGTSTVFLRDGDTQLLVDGFFTRPSFGRFAFSWIKPVERVVVDTMERAGIDKRLRAIFVTHAHYDHALDAPTIAAHTGAEFVGSRSAANVARGNGGVKESRIAAVGHCWARDYAPFRVTMVASRHGTPFAYRGDIDQPLTPPAHVSSWRAGRSFAVHFAHPRLNVLVHPGTNYIPGVYRNLCADVVFLSIAFLSLRSEAFAEAYWQEVVRTTGAQVVVPIHWDSFFGPLDQPLRPTLRIEYANSMRMLRSRARRDGVTLLDMVPFEPVNFESRIGRRCSGRP